MTDELVQTEGVIDLVTQIKALKKDLALLCAQYDESAAEFLSSRDALMSLVQDQGKFQIPEPKPFGSARSAKELENFLWDMEQYFTTALVAEIDKLNITMMYLIGDAKLWWCTRNADDESTGRPKIDTWNKLKKEMRDQFLPSNASWNARDKLKRLRQMGTIHDYIKEFTSLMKNVKDLPSAIDVADSLVDFCSTRSDSNIPSSLKSKKKTENKWKGKKYGHNDKGDMRKAPTNIGNAKNKGKDGNSKGCWICGGPHLAKSCLNHKRVNAMIAINVNQDGGDEVVATLANSLGLSLNHISLLNIVGESSKLFNNHHAALIHFEMKVDGNCMILVVDTRATHTFVDAKVAAKHGLKLKKSPSFVQTVSSKAQAVIAMAYDVQMVIGSWTGKHILMVMPLRDFEVILGIDFLRKFYFVPFPHLDGVMIRDETNPSFIKASYPYGEVKKGKNKGPINSAISVEKGLKRGAETFLAAMI
ncbi:hypothetical protein BC332_02629 [Capsicum chinense]|nr:hypothetical protein BC332_02629 [Capsicum chinense]